MTTSTALLDSPLRKVAWSTVTDAAGPILRRAAHGALVSDARLQVRWNDEAGEYELRMPL